ncbi:adhesion G protein-coupled receptor F4 [Scomber japonicus]|uniref:adhesion G protein-coupled receptor F4 n=1 Tax=Scomber japonicus TaxID=13676 RepID=UPI0023065DD3|nr:adhesion G protein-coupled receptor F4 [Scomber japonicus]
MWTFIFLYTLGLNIFQATGTEYSTQMYYVKLTIDQNAVERVEKELLTPFVRDDRLNVDGLKFTTTCETNENKATCECDDGYKWSQCQSDQDDCDKQVFNKEPIPSCISKSTVIINGPLHLINQSYTTCLYVDGDACREDLVNKITAPSHIVPYSSEQFMSCSVMESLGVTAEWTLRTTDNIEDEITDGTVSNVTSTFKNSTVKLRDVTERWAGEYTCTYRQHLENVKILHKASTKLDVALLPDIYISASPSFPHCKKSAAVKVKCEIQKSNESYKVEWEPKNIMSGKKQSDKNEKICNAENEWEDTPADVTAIVRCDKEVGFKQRHCNANLTWGAVRSACVDLEVNRVLQSAITADSGRGLLDQNAASVFKRLERVTNNTKTINTFSNMNASVEVLTSLSTKLQENSESINNDTTVNDVLQSSSNMLDSSLEQTWKENDENSENLTLAERYLSSVEQLIDVTNTTNNYSKSNLELKVNNCEQGSCSHSVFGVSVSLSEIDPDSVKTAGFQQLNRYLPNLTDYQTNSIVVSTTTGKKQTKGLKIKLTFPLITPRTRNFEIKCVAWNNSTREWSSEGCKWGGAYHEGECTCDHLSSFAILMSVKPLTTAGLTEITYVGLSISIVSLILSLAIELSVWSALVKSDALHLRHTAHINISLCLLIADCCFVASSTPKSISPIWCKTSVVLKHFCYLAMFFWMLCLSTTILHQTLFPFHNVSKKNYLRFALILGYVCPFLIVAITFLTNDAGKEGEYYSKETCWLIYEGLLKGSIHTFIIPVGIIVFVNIFCMVVVIMKLLEHPKNIIKSNGNEKAAVKTVLRSVILLTPIFGGTWVLGFGVTVFDLSYGVPADVVNYAFTLMNSLQGLFILLTTCLAEKRTREALMKHLRKDVSAPQLDLVI